MTDPSPSQPIVAFRRSAAVPSWARPILRVWPAARSRTASPRGKGRVCEPGSVLADRGLCPLGDQRLAMGRDIDAHQLQVEASRVALRDRREVHGAAIRRVRQTVVRERLVRKARERPNERARTRRIERHLRLGVDHDKGRWRRWCWNRRAGERGPNDGGQTDHTNRGPQTVTRAAHRLDHRKALQRTEKRQTRRRSVSIRATIWSSRPRTAFR